MALLSWIFCLLCVAGCRRSSASPVLHPALVVQPGQNVTLTCDLESGEVTWYQLRLDHMMLLLTVAINKFNETAVIIHAVNNSRLRQGNHDEVTGPVHLEILEAEPSDGGTYFCSGSCKGVECFSRGILLSVEGEAGSDGMSRPCWSGGICVLPASLLLVLVLVFIFLLLLVFVVCLCSGKASVCSWSPVTSVTEGDALHYSSLKHTHRPPPPGPRGARLVKEDVTYSKVTGRKNPEGSPDRR